VTDFPEGGMSNCTPGFPTPLACKYKDHSATVVIAMQQHHHRSTFVALLASCIILKKSLRYCDGALRAVGVALRAFLGPAVVSGFFLLCNALHSFAPWTHFR
jgi:hypothetical protein